MQRNKLEEFLNTLLTPELFQDYGPNGLQIEGNNQIKKIAFAVSATKQSVAQAVEMKADALVVHHGLFWKFHGTRTITGPFAKRVSPLIKNNINLFGYHLPLDAHPEVGNAATLAKKINLENLSPFGEYKKSPLGVQGNLKTPLSPNDFAKIIEKILSHKVIVATPDSTKKISSMGIITGGANGQWTSAMEAGLDAYLTGEISEHDWHEAQEAGVTFFAGGHNATEQFGVQALMEKIVEKFDVETVYFPSENPA